jgi:hypothetical protein
LVFGDPRSAERPLQPDVFGKIVVLERGKVTFAQKLLRAQEAGAVAVVVAQNAAVWPFMMQDTAQELSLVSTVIPIVMISQSDAATIEKLVAAKGQVAAIRVTMKDTLCSICQDDIEPGAEVLKLHCRHVYHTACVVSWLESHNTCPLCRLEMPKDGDDRVGANANGTDSFAIFG